MSAVKHDALPVCDRGTCFSVHIIQSKERANYYTRTIEIVLIHKL